MLDAGPWVEEKYRLLSMYMHLFSKGMMKRWDKRVYIDLYAGPGCTRVRETSKYLMGSPLIALSVQHPFDKYIFCEENLENMSALKTRVNTNFAHLDVKFIDGDCNNKQLEIIKAIPSPSTHETVLSFCFVDPFSLNLQFATIRKFSERFVDFLVLSALDMDARRNILNYYRTSNKKVDNFPDVSNWREKWKEFMQVDNSFQRFLAMQFEEQMLKLKYKKHHRANTKHVTTRDESLPLYHLAFFSRHEKGYQFWDECLKYSTDQQTFDF